MRDLFIKFRSSESGATLVEYGVALLLAIVLGGGALITLANQTGANMNAGCEALAQGGDASGVEIDDLCGEEAEEG